MQIRQSHLLLKRNKNLRHLGTNALSAATDAQRARDAGVTAEAQKARQFEPKVVY